MKKDRRRKCMKYSTVVGSILLLVPNGLFWYWGNLSVYSLSYLVSQPHVTSGVDAPWILSAFFVTWVLTVIVSEKLANRIERRLTILLGALVTDVGILTSYWAVQDSVVALTITMGLITGLGIGLMDSSALHLVIEWADEDTGLLTAAVQASLALGGFAINEITSLFINPNNLIPDVKFGQTKYFSQTEVLGKVPVFYLILGAISFGFHFIGFSMLRPKPTKYKSHADKISCSTVSKDNKANGPGDSCDPEVSEALSKSSSPALSPTKEYTPREVITTLPFLGLWLSFFIGAMTLLLVNSYYKSFGILWIRDDHFLTFIGTVMLFSSAWVSVIWGVLMDKFGVKNCFVLNLSVLTVVHAWYYLTPMTNKWLYFFVTIIMGNFAGTVYPTYTAATALLFGKTHFTSNFGVVMTSALLFNSIAPSIIQEILSQLGWAALFAIGGGLNIVRLVLILFCIPNI